MVAEWASVQSDGEALRYDPRDTPPGLRRSTSTAESHNTSPPPQSSPRRLQSKSSSSRSPVRAENRLHFATSLTYFRLVLTVVETPEYIKASARAGMSEEERLQIVDFVSVNPEAGVLLRGGLRKVRVPGKGGGKSGAIG